MIQKIEYTADGGTTFLIDDALVIVTTKYREKFVLPKQDLVQFCASGMLRARLPFEPVEPTH